MRKLTFLLFVSALTWTTANAQQITKPDNPAKISMLLNGWHDAAAKAKFDSYFDKMTKDAVFIGTDPTENWNLDQFKAFAKPYFDKGKAWNFTVVERHVFFAADGKTAWFDELLDTQMKICRGSGVARMENGQWKIAHYVLSMTIPNENVDEVVKIKSAFDDAILEKLKKN